MTPGPNLREVVAHAIASSILAVGILCGLALTLAALLPWAS